jgi:hypothetical protein
MSDETPLDEIQVSRTARTKRDRYLTPDQFVGRPHPTTRGCTTIRDSFFGMNLNIVFTIERDHVVAVTQMSQHSQSLRGRFYERVGTTTVEAVATASD